MDPVTRKEMFLAKAAGQNVTTPAPVTREEMFLEKIAENGGAGGASSWNDLKDKPFGEVTMVELVPSTTFTLDEDGSAYIEAVDFVFAAGRTYILNWNGTDYTCVAVNVDEDGDGVAETPMIGNIGIVDGEDNGIPFVSGVVDDAWGFYAFDGSTEVTVSLRGETLTKIPKEYLPNIMKRVDVVFTIDTTLTSVTTDSWFDDIRMKATAANTIVRGILRKEGVSAALFMTLDEVTDERLRFRALDGDDTAAIFYLIDFNFDQTVTFNTKSVSYLT